MSEQSGDSGQGADFPEEDPERPGGPVPDFPEEEPAEETADDPPDDERGPIAD